MIFREIRSIEAISSIIRQYSKSEFQKMSFVLFLFQIKNLTGCSRNDLNHLRYFKIQDCLHGDHLSKDSIWMRYTILQNQKVLEIKSHGKMYQRI